MANLNWKLIENYWNLSLKCFLQRNKGRIYSLTPTTKSRRSRSARSAAFMQNSERMESSQARIVSLICSQRTNLIYNFPILNFHLLNSSCSAAVDRVRNSSGKLSLPLLRQEDSPVVLAQDLTANLGRLSANFGSSFNANRVTPSLIKRLLEELINMTFPMSKLWHGEINEKKKGGALKISEYFLLYFAIPAKI